MDEGAAETQPVSPCKRSSAELTTGDCIHALQASDARKARRRASQQAERAADAYVVLDDNGHQPKRPTLLGPILEQRFGAFASSSSV